jgi:hypothetical protein
VQQTKIKFNSTVFGFSFRIFLLSVFFLVINSIELFATHLRAGQVRIEYVSERTVRIIIEVWTNIENTTVLFGGDQDVLDFGDGKSMLIPETQNLDQRPGGPPLPPNVKYAFFEVLHTYDAPGIYIVSYKEPNRNEGVLNMDASVTTTFYLETKFIIDPFIGVNNSPKLAIDPIDRACPGVAFFHNPGAHDPDPGDRLTYEMKVPYSDRNRQVINYRDPNNASFYSNPNQGNETGTEPPVFNINQTTGTITWDAPGKVGEYNIAFHIIEHREIGGVWTEIGYVRRDMQILVEDCDNERPTLELPPDTCVIAGTLLEVPIIGRDPDGDKVKIEAFSPIFNNPYSPPATITPDPKNTDVFVDVPATTQFSWQTECDYVREQPYFVVFKITDKPDLGPRLATFETWSIKVIGDKPVWQTATKNEANQTVNLTWEDYYCQNAVSMQVWRKVDGSDFEPDNCETGMPSHLGYELISTVPLTGASPNSFTDTNGGRGLEVGPRYCYRLVAVFPESTGAQSLVSDDICVEPFELVDPVITNVDVDLTSQTNGRIIVRWMPPQENDDYPANHPFRYRIYRGEGFSGDSSLLGTFTTDTFLIDESGLDTEGKIYNYTVHAYSDLDVLVGSSSQASTVRLEAASELREIEITWSATGPWTNNASGYTHKIYRGDEGADSKDDLVLIDEVNVSAEGFIYEDRGQWNGVDLEQKFYCYMVETYGTYGNPLIPEPLINRSQIVCTEPGDDIPPCQPNLPFLEEPRNCSLDLVTASDCAGASAYVNKLRWTKDDSDCARDVSYYIVYYSNAENGEYKELKRLPPNVTAFDDVLYTSYARCYRIAAVDRSGNISELSGTFCVDNCPYYELPNIFTPNRDGCNDVFRAYSNESFGEGGESTTPCTPTVSLEDQKKCARFVERVVFHVYNRWGREVFTYTGQVGGSSDNSRDAILINWDGRTNEGQELSTGVYYYVAEVTFISIHPENRNKTIKGWVHLVRGEN